MKSIHLSILMLFTVTFGFANAEEITLTPSQDNSLFEEGVDLSNGSGEYLFTGTTAQRNQLALRRGLLGFDISGIPAGSSITGAALTMNMSRTVAGDEPVSLHRALSGWGEGASDAVGQEGRGTTAMDNDTTWTNAFFPGTNWTNEGGDFAAEASATIDVGARGFYTWSSDMLISDVQSWLDDPAQNFGWMIIGNEEVGRTAKRFDSRENPTEANRPALAITFDPPMVGGLLGDFNADEMLDAQDIDLLTTAVRTGDMDSQFDLNSDTIVDAADRTAWIIDVRKTFVGDANLDGEFNSSDFVAVFQTGEYEDGVADNSTWSTGDWNGDGEFDTSDFVEAFQAGGYEMGPRAAVAAVPEPTSLTMLGFGALLLLVRRRTA